MSETAAAAAACARCEATLPAGRVLAYCTECRTKQSQEHTLKRKRSRLDELLDYELTLAQKTEILATVKRLQQSRWQSYGFKYETLMRQANSKQKFACALTRANLGVDSISLLREHCVFVLPLVSLLLNSFSQTPAVHVVAAIYEWGGHSRRGYINSNLLAQLDAEALSKHVRDMVMHCGRYWHGFSAATVERRLPPDAVPVAPYVCAETSVSLSSMHRDPASAVYFEGRVVCALYWLIHSLKERDLQVEALRHWLHDCCGARVFLEAPSQTFGEFVRAAIQWCA